MSASFSTALILLLNASSRSKFYSRISVEQAIGIAARPQFGRASWLILAQYDQREIAYFLKCYTETSTDRCLDNIYNQALPPTCYSHKPNRERDSMHDRPMLQVLFHDYDKAIFLTTNPRPCLCFSKVFGRDTSGSPLGLLSLCWYLGFQMAWFYFGCLEAQVICKAVCILYAFWVTLFSR